MNVNDHLLLWNQSYLRIVDIRHSMLRVGEEIHSYRLPASTVLYSVRGRAQVHVDGAVHCVNNSYICHAGKGACLDIVDVMENLEYYLILYKALLPLPSRQELLRLMDNTMPFQIQYGFAPMHPASLYMTVSRMAQVWNQTGSLEKLRAKALFYQVMCEVLQQLQLQSAHTTQPNPVAQAIRYIDEHYAEPITLDSLAELLCISARTLQRVFKTELGIGPIDYVIQMRIIRAQELIRQTNVSLKEIAEMVGYKDSYYFSRIFKKYCGVSPLAYKESDWSSEPLRQNPSLLSRYSIAGKRLQKYNGHIENENQFHLEGGGAVPMFKSSRSMLAINLMLALTLLLGACSSPTSSSSSSASVGAGTNQVTTQPVSTESNTKEEAKPIASRTIKHLKGEITLDFRPVKIAVLDAQFMDQMLALDEQPAGSVVTTADAVPFPEYLADKLKDVKVLGTKDEPNAEAVLAMEPDLIVCTEFQEAIYEKLSHIAPTIMLERNEDWRDALITFGKILDKEEEAKKVVSDYNEKVSKLKADLAAKMGGQTVALIRPRDNNIRMHTTAHRTAAILYNDLGLAPPKQAINDKETSMMISLEALPEMNADHLFVLTEDSNQKLTDEFQSTQVWKGLKAVKENHVYHENTTLWIAYYGPIAMNLVIDQIADALL